MCDSVPIALLLSLSSHPAQAHANTYNTYNIYNYDMIDNVYNIYNAPLISSLTIHPSLSPRLFSCTFVK